jgi:hypothetical protein
MPDALCDHLLEKPKLCQDKIVLFVLGKFNLQATTSSIGGALKFRSWTKKKICYVARGRNADLQTYTCITRRIRVSFCITMFS